MDYNLRPHQRRRLRKAWTMAVALMATLVMTTVAVAVGVWIGRLITL